MAVKLKPSSAWAWCSALPFYEDDSPLVSLPSETRDDGIACAWAADQIIKAKGLVKIPDGTLAPNGVVITQQMLNDVVDPYLLALDFYNCDQDIMSVESELRIPMDHFPTQPIAIMDFAKISSKAVVTIRDLKAGGIYVPAEFNYQLMQYCEAIYATATQLCQKAGFPGVMGWDLGIIQPRLNNYSSWSFTDAEWLNVHRVDLWTRASRINDPKETPGSHCKNCAGRHRCTTSRQLGLWGAEIACEMTPVDLPLNVLEHEYEMLTEGLDSMKSRISGLKAEIVQRIKQGGTSVYAMHSNPGNLSFDVPAKVVIKLGDDLGIDLRSAAKTRTPLQSIKDGVPEGIVNLIASRKSGKLELKKQDANLAKKTFNL